MLNTDQLAEIKARCDVATAGPWFVAVKDCQDRPVRGYNTDTCMKGDLCIIDRSGGLSSIVPIISTEYMSGCGDVVDIETKQFIANSRSDIPALLAHIEEQNGIIERLIEERDRARRHAEGVRA